MRRDTGRRAAPVLILPLMALIGGCSNQSVAASNVVAAPPAAPEAPLSPTQAAEQIVRREVGGVPVRFAEARVFDSRGATIVCGRFAQDGQAGQRYIVVGEQDLFIESRMAPGEMEQAVAETCRGVR